MCVSLEIILYPSVASYQASQMDYYASQHTISVSMWPLA